MIRKLSGIQKSSRIPVLTDKEKVEVLAETIIKMHSNDNIPEKMRRYRRQRITEKRGHSGSEFTMYEMKRALSGVRKISPGKDEICVELIKNLSETSLKIILV